MDFESQIYSAFDPCDVSESQIKSFADLITKIYSLYQNLTLKVHFEDQKLSESF